MSEPAPGDGLRRTGEPGVDATLDRLAELVRVAPAEAVPGYHEVHRRLADALADPAES